VVVDRIRFTAGRNFGFAEDPNIARALDRTPRLQTEKAPELLVTVVNTTKRRVTLCDLVVQFDGKAEDAYTKPVTLEPYADCTLELAIGGADTADAWIKTVEFERGDSWSQTAQDAKGTSKGVANAKRSK